jgi:hypothetical protein
VDGVVAPHRTQQNGQNGRTPILTWLVKLEVCASFCANLYNAICSAMEEQRSMSRNHTTGHRIIPSTESGYVLGPRFKPSTQTLEQGCSGASLWIGRQYCGFSATASPEVSPALPKNGTGVDFHVDALSMNQYISV